MKRMAVVGMLVSSLVLSGTSVSAATKPDLVLKGFQSYVASAKSTLSSNKTQYDTSVAAINLIYSNSASAAKSMYDKEILSEKNLYEPQINTATQLIKDAKAKLLTVNQVKVLKQGNDRNKWGYLNCPTSRLDCKYVDKGELFVIGEVTSLKSVVGENVDYITGVQSMIDEGLIELLSPAEYQSAANLIKNEPVKVKTLTMLWDSESSSAKIKQDKALSLARNLAGLPLSDLSEKYEAEKKVLESQITAGNLAIRAAKRASKNPSTFDKAFVTAYKFEYNVRGLDDIANLSFSSLNTLRSYLSQFAIIELADKALGIEGYRGYTQSVKLFSVHQWDLGRYSIYVFQTALYYQITSIHQRE
jgi:hypothetical protein